MNEVEGHSLTTQEPSFIEREPRQTGMTSGAEAASRSLPSRDFVSLSCRDPLSPVDATQDLSSVNRLGHQAQRSVKDLVVNTDDTQDRNAASRTEEEGMCADMHRRSR